MAENLKAKQRKSMVARRLLEVRTEKGLNQYDLAQKLECTQGLISQYETASTTITLDVLIDLCDALGCSVDYLLGREVEYDITTMRGQLLFAFERMPSEIQRMFCVMANSVLNL